MVKKLLLVVSLILLAFSACSGGTSGSVIGTRQSCQSSGGIVTCQGRINKLSGTYSLDLETSYFSEEDVVRLEAYFTIEKGKMKVSIDAPDGSHVEVDVAPGSEGILIGLTTVESSMEENVIPITLQAIDGDTEGIDYEIYFALP